jgi:hypothetical protein
LIKLSLLKAAAEAQPTISQCLKLQKENREAASFLPVSPVIPQGVRRVPATRRRSRWKPLLDGQAEALTQKAIELALGGDMMALRMCLDRILPARKDRPVSIEMPTINTAEDAKSASAALLAAVAAGSLTPSEAAEIGKLVDGYVRAVETTEVLKRLEKLEKRP